MKAFTQEAQSVLAAAYKQAAAEGHRGVETEHLLIAIVESRHPATMKLLKEKAIELEPLRSQLMKLAARVSSARQARQGALRQLVSTLAGAARSMLLLRTRLPYSLRVKKALALALHEARDLGQAEAGIEHILLGLIREADGNVPRLLKSLGIDLNLARKVIAERAGQRPDQSSSAP